MSSSMGKAPRVLACVLTNRYSQCDRNTPCKNCIKANVPCTPSTPAPPRKRRKPNQDLQQRLARCEELLSEYTTGSRPSSSSHEPPSRDEAWPPPMGKLIIDNEGVKFTDSQIWANMHRELSAMREILEDDETDDGGTPSDDTGIALVLSDSTQGSVEEFRPSPAYAFRLWQTFLERVNPLTKVIHVPTVQPQLVEATADPASTPKNVEALLFAIYLVAAVALSERECQDQLGMSKDAAYNRFSNGCRIALMHDLAVLQALVLYLFSLTGRFGRHGAWILNGVTVRVAQKMGLHRDGELLGLSPFETEIRRRIWWQIILIDAIYALMSGLGQSLLPRSWDTKIPLNINDGDLYPTMTAVQAKEGPTDMIYCLICYETGKMMMSTPHLESLILMNETASTSSPPLEEIEKTRRTISDLEQNYSDLLEKYSDPSMGPVHQLAAAMPNLLITKLKELTLTPKEQPEFGTEIFTLRDNTFKIAVAACETDVKLLTTTQVHGPFFWFLHTHFQIEMLIYLAGQLSERLSGSLVDRAWTLMELHYRYRDELFALSSKTHLALAILVSRGWKAREQFFIQTTGVAPPTPDYIVKLRRLVPSPDDAQPEPAQHRSSMIHPDPAALGADIPWDQMLGLADVGPVDWSVFTGGSESYDTKLEPPGDWNADDRRW
ncbi:hypothetical protein F5Y16DRAFT_409523 [Xylariaceae sp. FL0255]|nr:hypothetical protein F5Y16DRAFT_409523 [Xylariaceae sp. FL0255]